jgi:hypothetical protein
MAVIFIMLLAILGIGMLAGLRRSVRPRLLLATVVLTMILYEMVSVVRHY